MISVTPLSAFAGVDDRSRGELTGPGEIPTFALQREECHDIFWVLRLTEAFGDRFGNFGYQPPVNWVRRKPNLLVYEDGAVSLDERRGGSCRCELQVSGDTLQFKISVTNLSELRWVDCWGWLCLIHRWARAFQANCELPVGDGEKVWVSASSLDAPVRRWLKWCPVIEREEIAIRVGRNQGTRLQPHIRAREPAVRAWRVHEKKRQVVELRSDDAFALGWSHWPCTDMGVYFGTLDPGESGNISGRLSFFEQSVKAIG